MRGRCRPWSTPWHSTDTRLPRETGRLRRACSPGCIPPWHPAPLQWTVATTRSRTTIADGLSHRPEPLAGTVKPLQSRVSPAHHTPAPLAPPFSPAGAVRATALPCGTVGGGPGGRSSGRKSCTGCGFTCSLSQNSTPAQHSGGRLHDGHRKDAVGAGPSTARLGHPKALFSRMMISSLTSPQRG